MIYCTDINDNLVTMKRGQWYLTAPAALQPTYLRNGFTRNSSIIHWCNPYSPITTTMAFPVDYLDHGRYNRTKLSWRCVNCFKKPPESILTVFILQNFDWCSEEISREFGVDT